MSVDITVEEIHSIVSRLYEKAISQINLRPEQAFAYVQDETDSLCSSGDIGAFAVLQTAIFMEGMRYGLELSRESPYAEDMLEGLASAYDKCSVGDLAAVGLEGEQLADMIDSMRQVREKYLFSK
ncbi:hypothetical protein [Pseudomonas sp. PSE14]|uniref:hypothetical protein n=1 Tax=Pseudomonas sp. PSE14 TaxID=3016341 RepID=UPI0023D853C6|nr:hypothetical protein [Pseudomonas sp. PSE14]WEJ72252.1 hypothetical protein O6P39_27040 [Pseudomonas sp. PSE14]